MSKQPLNAREQELLNEHLPYELDQLETSYVLAAQAANTDVENRIRLIAIDCFYLHTRNLIEFYEGNEEDGSKTRVHAKRFTNGMQDYPAFGSYSVLINDQVTHLQLDRGSHAKAGLSLMVLHEIKEKLDAALCVFQKALTNEARQYWVDRCAASYSLNYDAPHTACNEIYQSFASSSDIKSLNNLQFTNQCGGDASLTITIMVPTGQLRSNN